MRTTTKKKLPGFGVTLLLLLFQFAVNAQTYYYSTCTCLSTNPPGYCYTDKNGNTKCHKYTFPNGPKRDPGPCACDPIAYIGRVDAESPDAIYANHISNSASIYVTVQERQEVSLKIFDQTGKLVSTLVDGFLETGEHKTEWSTGTVNPGVYTLRLQTAEAFESKRLLVLN